MVGREKLNINGIKKIRSSEPEQIVLALENNSIVISGVNLTVTSANIANGEIEILGLVNGIKYTNAAGKKKFSLKNMFR